MATFLVWHAEDAVSDARPVEASSAEAACAMYAEKRYHALGCPSTLELVAVPHSSVTTVALVRAGEGIYRVRGDELPLPRAAAGAGGE